MPNNQMVDHWYFPKKDVNEQGEVWKENQIEVGIFKRNIFTDYAKSLWLCGSQQTVENS